MFLLVKFTHIDGDYEQLASFPILRPTGLTGFREGVNFICINLTVPIIYNEAHDPTVMVVPKWGTSYDVSMTTRH